MGWIDLTEDKNQRRAVLNKKMNLRVPWNTAISLLADQMFDSAPLKQFASGVSGYCSDL